MPSVDVLGLRLERQAIVDDLLHPHLLGGVERQLQELERALTVAGRCAGEEHNCQFARSLIRFGL